MTRGLLSLLALVLLAGATSHAQQPSFRSDVNFVEVHAVVTDERGTFIRDLTRHDFQIFEDGRPQTPVVFELIDLPATRAASATPSFGEIESDVRSSARTFDGRLYVFVLDDLHTTTLRSPHVRQAAANFIDEHLGPNDMAAIVYTSGRQDAAQELTASRRLLRESVAKFQGRKLPSASAERLAVHLRERDMDGAARSEDDAGASSSRPSVDRRVDDPFDAERGFNARRSLEMVRDVAQWLTDVKGRRKALVFFSEGIDYDIYDVFNNKAASGLIDDARDAIAAAQRANVSIYAVDPRGLTQLGDQSIEVASLSPDATVEYGSSRDFQRELLLSQESLLWLAEDTGGIALVRTNDIRGGLRRIAEDNSRYYVLGYTSDQSKKPGRFRSIEVKVNRPGVKVRARRGYLPADPKALAGKKAREVKAGTSPALTAALNNPLPLGELPVRVFASAFKGAGKNGSVLLSIEVDGRALKFHESEGRFTNKLEFSIAAADHQGKVRDTDRQELNLKLKPETRDRVLAGGVRVLSRLELPPARYQLRVGVHESVGGAVSTVPYDLEIPDYSEADLTLSGLTLTSTAAGAFMTPQPDAQLRDVFPAPPVATRSFLRDERVGVYVELYDNSAPAAHTVDFTTTVRPIDDLRPRFSAQESRTIEAGTAARTHGFTTEIPLRELAPGQYVLRVEATSRFNERTVAREVPFEVNEAPRTTTY
jgi:VWFA-related protein